MGHVHNEYCAWRHGRQEAPDRAQRRALVDFLGEHPEFRPNPDDRPDGQEQREVPYGLPSDFDVEKLGFANPLVSQPAAWSEDIADTQRRLDHVWGYLRGDQQDLIQERVWEQRTFEEMAADRGITYQAVQQRLETAFADLRKVIADRWEEA